MKYLIMLMSGPGFQAVWDGLTEEQQRAVGARHRALSAELAGTGELIAAEGLDEVGLTRRVRVRDGRTLVSDGPLAEAKEHLAGFYLVDCDQDRAVRIAARIPDAEWSEVLIRPVLDLPAHGV